MSLLDGFLVALNIIVLTAWVWRQWPQGRQHIGPLVTRTALCHTRKQLAGVTMPRVIQDSIPFVILFGLILLTVWLWRRFKDR